VFGEGRLRALLSELAGQAPTRVVQRIEAAVLAASGGRPRDDLAIVALRVRRRRR
jgi:serine phosphatase RsbU (regulator of sigma subunit)